MSQNELTNIIKVVRQLYRTANTLTAQEALQATDNIYSLTLLMVRNRRSVPLTLTQNTTRNPREKTKVISKKKLDEECPTTCTICHETPKYKDAIQTDCGHYYCKQCWSQWMNTIGSKLTCPCCRKDKLSTTSFKGRVTKPKTKPVPFIIEY